MNTESAHRSHSHPTPLMREFEFLYLRLQEFKEEGEGDSFHADGLRLRLDYLFDDMEDDERIAVRELIAKLNPPVEGEEEIDDYDDTAYTGDDRAEEDEDADEEEQRYSSRDVTDDEDQVEEPIEEDEVEEVAAELVEIDEEDEEEEEPVAAKPEPVKPRPAAPAKPPVVKAPPPVVKPKPVAPVIAQEEVVEVEAVEAVDATPAIVEQVEVAPIEIAETGEAPTHTPLAKPAEIFDRSITFASLGLHPALLKGILEKGFEHPTDIQAKLIPPALAGFDLIGQARTGTGKTAAFGMPIIHQADADIPMQGLVLVPTRELAAQVTAELDELARYTPIRATCIIGGESMRDQAKSIAQGGHLMVGTPGRVMDMQQRGQINFDRIRFIVLDEVDRMLDIGFREDIRKILKSVRCDHQTIFVSATISDEIERLARSFMKPDAQKIITISGSLTVSLVDQKYVSVEPWDKRSLLLHIMKKEKPESTVVFCRTKATVDKLAKYLSDHKIDARPIHGDMPQNKRTKVMDSMRQGKLAVLIASDLAARGLDIDHITHVVNYDLPEDPEVYVHRIGRTARVGRRGVAWSFVTRDEGQRLTEIEMLCSTMIERMEYPDFKPGPVPDDIRMGQPRAARITERPTNAVELMAAKAAERTAPSVVDGLSEEQLKAMFPDGNIPKSLPKSTLGSKFRRKR